jgi:hypothetical protein
MNTQRLIFSTASSLLASLFLAGTVFAQPGPGSGNPGGPPDNVPGVGSPGGPPDNRPGFMDRENPPSHPGLNPPRDTEHTPPGLDSGWTPPGLDPEFSPPGPGDDMPDDDIPGYCAGDGAPIGPGGQAGLSSIAHLNFSAEDDEDGETDNDGWGRLTYRWIAPVFDYVFNGHELEPGVDFTLTYQPQPFPSDGVICLGQATVNPGGNLHVQDAFDIGTDLPAAWDENEDEAVLALVLTDDVDCDNGQMLDWQPEAYLFGEEMMFYVHSDLPDDDEDNGDD